MRFKILCALTALAVTLGAAPARADDGDRRSILFSVQNPGDGSASCPGDLFGISFDMASLRGAPLGTGVSCVHAIDGCYPFAPFCRQTVHATWTLEFARGTLTAPMRLREILPSETSFLQRGDGRIAAGTGAFDDSRGRVMGGGGGTFSDHGFVGKLIYAVVLQRK